MIVEVLIAHRTGVEERDHNLPLCVQHYEEWPRPITIRVVDAPGRPFSRAASFNMGVASSMADVVVCSNSDIIVPHDSLDAAVELAWEAPGSVYPFTSYRELTKECSEAWLAGDRSCRDAQYVMGEECIGPIFVVARAGYLRAGGCDERFVGWGFEDVAWSIVSDTLLAPNRRAEGEVIHLWHPPMRYSRRGGGQRTKVFQANKKLCDEYRKAAGSAQQLAQVAW